MFSGVLELSKEVLQVSIGQKATQFSRISNFGSLQLCSPLTYKDLHHLFGKIYNSLKTYYQLTRLETFLRYALLSQIGPISMVLFTGDMTFIFRN